MHQGFPLRLIIPGWYGVANVKWLSEINVQEDPYLGKWQARNYRTLKGEMINGEMKWVETAISRMHLKSFVARVTKTGGTHKVLGVVLHDGTPIKSVEVKVDDGPWQPATFDPQSAMQKYALEAVHLQLEGRHPGRAHADLARHRRQRPRAADGRRPRQQEDVPRGQLADAKEDNNHVVRLKFASERASEPRETERAGAAARERAAPSGSPRAQPSGKLGELVRNLTDSPAFNRNSPIHSRTRHSPTLAFRFSSNRFMETLLQGHPNTPSGCSARTRRSPSPLSRPWRSGSPPTPRSSRWSTPSS